VRGRFLVPLVALLAVVATLAYVRTRFLLVELSYEVGQKRTQKEKLEQDRRALTLELAMLRSPSRIERIARKDLNLTRNESSVPVVVISGDPGP
jgi:cell division protein FtsL